MLGAIRSQILVPERVAYVVESAVAIVRERRDQTAFPAKRARLGEVSREIGRLVALAVRVDGVDELAEHLAALKREHLAAEFRAAEAERDLEALRQEIARRLADLGAALEATPDLGRRALRDLLRNERLRRKGSTRGVPNQIRRSAKGRSVKARGEGLQ